MTKRSFFRDANGASAADFAIIAPLFCLVLAGVAQFGLWVWTSTALQHGAELAARCATYNPTSCADAASITSYAATQSYGLNVSAASFSYAASACGNQVSATVTTANFLSVIGAPTMSARAMACFPK